jgi:amino acid transporter
VDTSAGRRSKRGPAGRLGTFGGVFVPSLLTILGIILLRRLGFVVGGAGLGPALAILAIATCISALTSVSLAAVATNRRVRGGGDYYLISRSLGVSFGGALGLILFAAQSISVAFYCVGFGEGVAEIWPNAGPTTVQAAAAALALVLLAVALLGADLATRFQYVIMAVLLAALVSFFVGGIAQWDATRLAGGLRPLADGPPFWVLFAIFFPAVTGFTQGVSMSGELSDPARSLPAGTFLAVGVSTLVYAAAMFVLAASLPQETLAGEYGAMQRVAWSAPLVDAGVLAATASSALASFLGAPRILQALASDRVFSSLAVFGVTSGAGRNPRRAVALTAGIAMLTIALGNLNAIASVVSMFFLISYGLLNYATYVEATGASPSFRPRFRFFHARASLAGTALCGLVMLAIDPAASIVAVLVLVAVYQYLERTTVPVRWRDNRRAYRFRRVKDGLRDLAAEPEGLRDWQPHILVFTEGEQRRERVLPFASWISGGTGMITAVQLVEGESDGESVRAARAEAESALREELGRDGLDAFPLVVAAPDLRVAAATVVQAWGVGPIRANTVLLNWRRADPGEESSAAALWYGRLLRSAIRLRQNVVVLDADAAEWQRMAAIPSHERRIDVWWSDDDSSKFSLLLAYLTTRAQGWDEATIRVLLPTTAEKAEARRSALEARLEEIRIEAVVEPVVETTPAGLTAAARDAALVLLPLRIEGMRIVGPFGDDPGPLFETLPVTALVGAADAVRLKEEPPPGEEPAAAPEAPDEA